ncbi:MAG: phosphosulfolactate synthase [Armatimonadetes bacterium]|nr:phosphosulfolactate synthase [Armatimonadota bacterium]
MVQAFRERVPLDRVILELPGRWVHGTQFDDVAAMIVWLVETLGAGVNVGNVVPEDVVILQNTRMRLGSNLSLADQS